MSLVHESVRQCLIDVLPTVSGLQAIYVTTQDGIELATAISDEMNNTKKEHLATVFAFAAERGSKLGLGNVQSAVSTFEDGLYVHVSFSPIVVTFVGEVTMNTSDVEDIIPLFKNLLEPVRGAVASVEDDEEDD